MTDAHAARIAASEAELVSAGFQPSRLGRIVYWVRRLLWPFVRPFHLHTLHRLVDAGDRLDRLEAALAALRAETARDADLRPVAAAQAVLRAELTSLVNRHVGVEDALRGQGGSLVLWPADSGVFVLKAGDLICETLMRDGHWDGHILPVARLAAARRPDGRAVDAGAHIGALSVPLGFLFARVASFEPNGFTAALLRANVALNGLAGRVEVLPNALFSRRVLLSMAPEAAQEIALPMTPDRRFDAAASENLGAYSFAEHGTGLYEAEARPLDDFEFDDLAFLKVDTQGADGEVLIGAMRTIERCRCWIVFEWEEHLSRNYAVTFDQVAARLARAGYTVRVLRRQNEKQVDYVAVPEADAGAIGHLTE
jgi:FkbM family methyltransferase